MVNLKVPVRSGVPETTPVGSPLKNEGKLVKLKVGKLMPLTLNLT